MYTAPIARAGGASAVPSSRTSSAGRPSSATSDLLLETGTAQPEAMALYESHGWHRITPYGHYRDSPESVCFAKELDRPA